jgi:hypothetical protein
VTAVPDREGGERGHNIRSVRSNAELVDVARCRVARFGVTADLANHGFERASCFASAELRRTQAAETSAGDAEEGTGKVVRCNDLAGDQVKDHCRICHRAKHGGDDVKVRGFLMHVHDPAQPHLHTTIELAAQLKRDVKSCEH